MDLNEILKIMIRLLLAGLLGGIIGFEREHTNRPAGFRTHILVCVGSSLVMVTSEFIFSRYSAVTDIDPARLGAQVISGIGFLGAGTIIRDGVNVRGLTTAASLWAVSCVGIATGAGFYAGAVAATVLIFLTLIILKKTEKFFALKNRYRIVTVVSENNSEQIGAVSSILLKYNMDIKNIEAINDNENVHILKFSIKLPGKFLDLQTLNDINSLEGVKKVYEE